MPFWINGQYSKSPFSPLFNLKTQNDIENGYDLNPSLWSTFRYPPSDTLTLCPKLNAPGPTSNLSQPYFTWFALPELSKHPFLSKLQTAYKLSTLGEEEIISPEL